MKPLSDAFSPDVMAELLRPMQSYDPRDAQILPDVEPKWYLLEVYEPAQREVERELAKRRFGIFVPEAERTEVKRGRKITRKLALFPGHIFVFVWDIGYHWSRITRLSGVARIVTSKPDMLGKTIYETDAGFGRLTPNAVSTAITIEQEMIDQIRALENGQRPIIKRRTRGKRRQYDDDVIATYPWSAYPERFKELDSQERNQSLRKALGLV